MIVIQQKTKANTILIKANTGNKQLHKIGWKEQSAMIQLDYKLANPINGPSL